MDLARRLSKYLYVAELIPRRRVLEIGCGDGASASFLMEHGAREVIGIDRSEAAVRAGEERGLPPGVRLSVAGYRSLALPDGGVDLVLVPDGAEVLRGSGYLDEIRRVLSPEGVLLFSVPSADRPGARGGVHYHELCQRLEPLFGPLRMAAQAPFGGWSLVEYADDGGRLLEIAFDATLVDRGNAEPEVEEYLALAGDHGQTRPFTVVQVPAARPAADDAPDDAATLMVLTEARSARAEVERQLHEVGAELAAARAELAEGERRSQDLAQALDAASAQAMEARAHWRSAETARVRAEEAARVAVDAGELGRLREQLAREQRARTALEEGAVEHAHIGAELARELDEAVRYAEEVERELRSGSERTRALEEARAKLVLELEGALAETHRLRARVATLEGEALARKLAPGGGADRAELAVRVVELEAALAKANARWKVAEDKSDEMWRKVGKAEADAVETRENAAKRALEQKAIHAQALTRAMDEAGRKLASAQDETLRERRDTAAARERLAAVEAELAAARERLAAVEAELAAARAAQAGHAAVEAELAAARAAQAAVEAELTAARSALAAVESELGTREDELTEARQAAELARVETARVVAAAADQVAAAQAELSRVQLEVRPAPEAAAAQAPVASDGAAAGADPGAAAAAEATAELAREVARLRGELASARGELAGLSVELAAARESEGEGESLRAALLSARDAMVTAEASEAAAREVLAAVRMELEAARTGVAPLREALAATRGEAAAARDEAARERREATALRAELDTARQAVAEEREATLRRERQLVEDSVRLIAEAEERALAAEEWAQEQTVSSSAPVGLAEAGAGAGAGAGAVAVPGVMPVSDTAPNEGGTGESA